MHNDSKQFKVVLEHSGPDVYYGEGCEFSGSREECEAYIAEQLRMQREIPGMQNTGTFLKIRPA